MDGVGNSRRNMERITGNKQPSELRQSFQGGSQQTTGAAPTRHQNSSQALGQHWEGSLELTIQFGSLPAIQIPCGGQNSPQALGEQLEISTATLQFDTFDHRQLQCGGPSEAASDRDGQGRNPLQSSGQAAANIPKISDDGTSTGSGRVENPIDLLVNHFKVEFAPDQKIFSYQVYITPQGASGSETNMSMADRRCIMNKIIKDQLAAISLVYDGTDNLYSPVELGEEDFSAELPKDKDSAKEYTVELKRKASSRIMEFLDSESGGVTVNQELLQKLGVVIKEYPRSSYMVMGQCFYEETTNNSGIVTAEGFSMSLRPTAQGLNLNVDYSIYVTISVMKYLEMKNIWMPPNDFPRSDVENALTGLKVTVNHRQKGQKFTVMGLTGEAARDIKFKTNGGEQETSIMDYYKARYNKTINYVDLPCLDLSKKGGEQNYVPMEFCEIWQRVLKHILNSEEQKTLQRVINPSARQEKIDKFIEKKGPIGGPYLAGFGMTVHPKMTQVTGRILDAPELMLSNENGAKKKLTPSGHKRQWNMTRENKNTVCDGKTINNWGIIHFSKIPNKQKKVVDHFRDEMVSRFRQLGIGVKQEPVIFEDVEEDMLNNGVKLKKEVEKIHRERNKKLDILICILECKHSGYKSLKLICETKIGLATQCCLFQNVKKCANLFHRNHPSFKKNQSFASQYLANFALKVNAKLGGSNVVLSQSLFKQIPCIRDSDAVYFGADVNHPSNRDKECPSIAAVVMSINWPDSNRYVVRIQRQEHRQEIISNLGDICHELLQVYAETKHSLPERIIFFRDGVGNWQFDEVRKKELEALKDALKKFGGRYNPKLTFILAQKRHRTRLFPESGDQNVPPGTVVDSAEIVHPSEVNFYLCSHHNELGTSKVTHYYVLFNEIGFSPEDLQTFIYHLCFTFATCTKPVSLVPPVYYADRAAYRGRLYVEAERSLSTPNTYSSSKLDTNLNVQLQGDKSMFFI